VVWTPDETCSHADVVEPLNRMESNIASDEWRGEVVIAGGIAVRIATKLLWLHLSIQTLCMHQFLCIEMHEGNMQGILSYAITPSKLACEC